MLTLLIVSFLGMSFDLVNDSKPEVVRYNLITRSEPLANVVEFTAPASGPEVPRLEDSCNSGNCPAATKTTVKTSTACESGNCGSYSSYESSEVITYGSDPVRRRGLFGLFRRGSRCRGGSCR